MTDAPTAANATPSIAVLRDAFRDWAHPSKEDVERRNRMGGPERRSWDRADLDRALRNQGVAMSDPYLEATFDILRKRSFMGGNYTLDARAVHAALAGMTAGGQPNLQSTVSRMRPVA